MNMRTSELDSCLIELEHILSGLMASNYYFQYYVESVPTLNTEFQSVSSKIDNIGPIQDILLESMIIQLDKLFEIQPQLGKCLKEINQTKLTQVLKDDWMIIKKNHDTITMWRNGMVAHSTQQSKNYLPYHKLDPNHIETQESILSTSRFAVIYLWAIVRNILPYFQKAMDRKDQLNEGLKVVDKFEFLATIIHNEKKFFTKINEDLKKNSLETIIFCGYDDWPINTKNEDG